MNEEEIARDRAGAVLVLLVLGLVLLAIAPGVQASTSPVTLTWDAPTLNVDGSPVRGPLAYRIHRSQGAALAPEAPLVGTVSALSFVDAVPAGPHCWGVRAVDAGGLVSEPATVCAVAPIPRPLPVGGSAAELCLVSGASSGSRVVYARSSTGGRGARIGSLAVGLATGDAQRVRCSCEDRFVAAGIRYARIIDPAVSAELRAGYVSGCVSVGVQP